MTDNQTASPDYAPLVKACKAFGIGKTKAFELASEGKIRTFLLGCRRFVYMDSLRSLPQRTGTSERGGS